jgi:outer membrane protein assembly factor BamA
MCGSIAKQAQILLFLAVTIFFFGSCSSNKYLNEGEAFLEANEVRIKSKHKIKNKSVLKGDLATLYQQPETRTFFGIPRHWFYYKTINNPDSTWFKGWVQRKIADPPVIYDSLQAQETASVMEAYLRQKGYLDALATFRTKTDKRRATVVYSVDPMERWRVQSIQFISRDDSIQQILNEIAGETILKPGEPVDLELYNNEKRRITRAIQNRGYVNFFANYIAPLQADSADLRIKLVLEVLNPTDSTLHKKYRIGEITVYPDFTMSDGTRKDTVIDGIAFVQQTSSPTINPSVVVRNLYLRKGAFYNRDDYDKTYKQLSKLDAYKFVSIKSSVDSLNQDLINYSILLTRNKKMGIGGDFEVNYSTISLSQRSLMGLSVNFNYRNRNLLRGAEVFLTNLETGIEINLDNPDTLINSFNVSLQNSLYTPKFIDPIGLLTALNKVRLGKNGIVGDRLYRRLQEEANTKHTIGYNFLSLINFYRYHSVNLSLGYDIQPDIEHRLILNHMGIDLFTPITKKAFNEILEGNRFLAESFGKQLFTGFLFRDYTSIYNMIPNAGGFSWGLIHSI